MKKILALVLCGCIVLGFSGCEGNTPSGNTGNSGNSGSNASSGNSGSGESSGGGHSQGVTDTEIIVANSAAVSGAYAPVGEPFLKGIEAYFEMINDGGGIDGRKIKFIHKDDEFDPVKGKAYLKEFINDDKVFAIVGHFGTPVVGATLNDLKEAGIPAVYFATGMGQLFNENAQGEDRNIYPVQPIYISEGKVLVTRAVGDFDAKKIGIIYTNDDAGMDLLNGATVKAEELGVELISQQVTVGSADVSAAVTSIKQADVDVIIGAAIQGTFPTVVKELAAQSVNKPVLTTYVNASSAITDAIKDDIAGKFDVYANAWVDLTSGDRAAAYEQYVEWTKKYTGSDDYANNTYAMTGWIAAHFFSEGLKNVEGDITWENYMAALESKPIQNPFGGEIDFSDGKRLGTEEMSLTIADSSNPTGWSEFKPMQSISAILGD